MQYPYHLPPLVRANFDYLLVSQMNQQSIDLIYDEYISHMDRKEFNNLYKKSVIDYNFLLINCNTVKDLDDVSEIYSLIKCNV